MKIPKMPAIIAVLTVLNVAAVGYADCRKCKTVGDMIKSADALSQSWTQANTKDRRMNLSGQSFRTLRTLAAELGKRPNEAGVAAAVRLLGMIYERDYDPMTDTLALFQSLLESPDFRPVFDKQLAKLPTVQAEKLREGLVSLAARPSDDAGMDRE